MGQERARRFYLFGYDAHDECGGWDDFIGSYVTAGDAIAAALESEKEYWHIIHIDKYGLFDKIASGTRPEEPDDDDIVRLAFDVSSAACEFPFIADKPEGAEA